MTESWDPRSTNYTGEYESYKPSRRTPSTGRSSRPAGTPRGVRTVACNNRVGSVLLRPAPPLDPPRGIEGILPSDDVDTYDRSEFVGSLDSDGTGQLHFKNAEALVQFRSVAEIALWP